MFSSTTPSRLAAGRIRTARSQLDLARWVKPFIERRFGSCRRSLSPTLAANGRLPAVTLLTELDAFYTEHRRCGKLDAGVKGPVVWIACPCGASMARRADAGDAFAFDG